MREGFETVVAALWASLGLGVPRLDGQEDDREHARPRAVLRVDGRTVALTPSPDGRNLHLIAAVGTLAADPYRREEQLRRLLRDNLGMILVNRAALRLVGEGVEAVAVGPLRASEVPLLRELIEDALHLAEVHAVTLVPEAGRRRPVAGPARRDDDESLIFRI